MSDRRYTLDEQIAAMAVVVKGFKSAVNGGAEYQDRLIEYHAEALSAALETLRFVKAYQGTIRDAVSAERQLDAVAER